MIYKPYYYQAEAISHGVTFLKTPKKDIKEGGGLLICPTGSGKSVIIANICGQAEGKSIILQPSKEILAQNFQKFISYGYRAGIYSASAGMKYVDKITYATIGSVAKKHHLFREVKNIIIDECHLVNAEEGMLLNFIKAMPQAKVLGLTATPYRLSQDMEGAMLKFLTRTRPKVFSKVLYYIQNDILFNGGYLSPLKYFDFNLVDRTRLEMNAAGTDFTDSSLRAYNRSINLPQKAITYANKILTQRKSLLVFCKLVDEAEKISRGVPGSVVLHGETPGNIRDAMLKQFKAGEIRCIINVGVLTTGFDYPALEAVLIARSTMSLSIYYQIIGRVMRFYKYPDGKVKQGWVVDLGGNLKFFGKIESMKIEKDSKGLFIVTNNGRQLTNIPFSKS